MFESLALASAAVLLVNAVLAVVPLPRVATALAFILAGIGTYLVTRDVYLAAAVAGFANAGNVLLTTVAKQNVDAARMIRSDRQGLRIPTL